MFGISDDTAMLLGKCGEEAIENILSGKDVRILRSEVVSD